jgi:ADP-ribose pyrophosphatase YjhB (NUDIX family)
LLRLFRRLPLSTRRSIVRRLTPNFSVGAMAFIERADGAMLFVRHSYRSGWGVPGGLLQRHEEPDVAVRREVFEEVALSVELVGEPAVVVDAEPHRIDVVYRARLADSDIAQATPTSPEIVEAQWFSPDDLPELQFETSHALVALARSSAAPQARPLEQSV